MLLIGRLLVGNSIVMVLLTLSFQMLHKYLHVFRIAFSNKAEFIVCKDFTQAQLKEIAQIPCNAVQRT